jgi:hypothetical protein
MGRSQALGIARDFAGFRLQFWAFVVFWRTLLPLERLPAGEVLMQRISIRPHRRRNLVPANVVTIAATEPASSIIGGFIPAIDEYRFDAVAAFGVTNNLHCDYCTTSCSAQGGSGTLIDCEWMIISRHQLAWGQPGSITQNVYHEDWFPPPAGFWSFRFRRNPDGSIGEFSGGAPQQGACTFHHVTVHTVLMPENFDVTLAHLSEPVTHIEPIRVRFAPGSSFSPGMPILLAGWGQEISGTSSCPNPSYGPSRKLKVAETVVEEADSLFNVLDWATACAAACVCSAWSTDSGGAILVELPCGRVEIVGVITEPDHGVLIAQFEGNSTFPIPVYDDPCPGDLNGDGMVDGGDLGQLLLDWGTPGCVGKSPCLADLDCNGAVDGADLGILLLAWGSRPPGCDSQQNMQGSPGEQSSANTEADHDEAFHDWVMTATLEELFQWLLDGTWPDDQSQ